MTLTRPPAAEAASPPAPPKPAGVPGKWVVVGVVVASLAITAGFLTVKALRANPATQNAAIISFTDAIGGLERYMRRGVLIEQLQASGDAEGVARETELRGKELAFAEKALAHSVSTGLAPPPAVGWLAEVNRRRGELAEADRLFTEAIDGPAEAVTLDLSAEEDRRESFTPDPADLGGRALVRAERNDPVGAARDARRALDLFAAGTPTRAMNQFKELAPDLDTLARLAAADPGE